MRSAKTFNITLLICALALMPMVTQVQAQVATGDLTGRVEDAQGAVLPGVTLTATSPNLQGQRIVTSDANGIYRIPLMPPGTYTVTYELEGFATAIRQIKINAGTTTRSDPIQLPLSEVQEEIVVTGELETISKTNTGATTFEQEDLNKLPLQRNLTDTTLLAPGTFIGATGDESATGNTNVTISGAMSFENLFLMNGVVMNENLRGQAFDLFIEDAIQETTVSSSGISAEYGRFTGGVVNAITKSGGNQFQGSLRSTFNNNDWEAKTPLSDDRKDSIVPTYEATLGGYFWKDHLWFFGAYRDTETDDALTTRAVTNIPYTRVDTETRYEIKGTISPHPSHSIVASYMEIDEAQNNYGAFNFLDLRSLHDRTLPQEMVVGNYTGILTPKFFVEAQYSEREFLFVDSGSQTRDLLEGTLMRRRGTNHRYHAPTFCGVGPPACPPEERSNENLLAKGSYFLTTGAGTHDIVFGYDTFDDIRFSINRQTGTDITVWASDIVVDPNNNIFSQMGTNVWIGYWAVFNEDIAQPTNFTTNSFYVNDSWQLNDHWSFNIGLRYDINDGQDSSGNTTADDEKFSPRLGLSYDVKGDGDLVVFGSYAEYVAAIANTQADSTSTGGAIGLYGSTYEGDLVNMGPACSTGFNCVSTQDALATVFDWYFQNGTLEQYFDDPSLIPGSLWYISVPGVTSGVPTTVSSPSVEEISLGVTKRLGAKGLVRADLVFREWGDFYGDRNRPNDQVDGPTGDPVDFIEVGNFTQGLSREYFGVHTQASYRVMDRLSLAGNYTYSQLEGNIVGETTAGGPASSGVEQYREYKELRWNAPKGDLAGDARHKFRGWATYEIIDWEHHSLGVSWLENWYSGTPYGGVEDIDVEPYVDNPGYALNNCCDSINYWFTARDAFHTDDVHRSDLSFKYNFRWNAFGRQMTIFVRPDILNIFDEQAVDNVNNDVATAEAGSSTCTGGCQPFNPFTETPVEGVNWAKRDDFGQPEDEFDYQFPRTYRISIGFRF